MGKNVTKDGDKVKKIFATALFFFVTLLQPGVAAADSQAQSYVTAEAVISSMGLRGTPTFASPILTTTDGYGLTQINTEPIPAIGNGSDRGAVREITVPPRVIVGCEIKRCPRRGTEPCNSAPSKINPTNIVGYEIPCSDNGYGCPKNGVWFFSLNREGLDRSPGSSLVFLDADEAKRSPGSFNFKEISRGYTDFTEI
jgi:hypothetical protein